MMGLPLSWVVAIALLGATVSYILYLQWRARRNARKAAQAFRERDNAVVKQHATEAAQATEHAYQQTHDAAINKPQADPPKPLLERLNNTVPMVLMLLMFTGCASEPKVIEMNPAKQVVIPAPLPLEHYVWQDVLGYHCLDDSAAESYLRNDIKIDARIQGLEAALRELGAKVQ